MCGCYPYPDMSITAIVPAAGKASRFGGQKLLADVAGEPLLDRTLRSLLDGGVARVVMVTAEGADFSAVTRLHSRDVAVVFNRAPERGMFSSIQCGIAGATDGPIIVLPADMPFVKSGTVAAVIARAAAADDVIVPVHQGRRGHPIAIPERYREGLIQASPDQSLKAALSAAGAHPILLEVDDPGILRDVDEPQDLTSTF
jgi:molybdenum cofactor cytidylyltransferase